MHIHDFVSLCLFELQYSIKMRNVPVSMKEGDQNAILHRTWCAKRTYKSTLSLWLLRNGQHLIVKKWRQGSHVAKVFESGGHISRSFEERGHVLVAAVCLEFVGSKPAIGFLKTTQNRLHDLKSLTAKFHAFCRLAQKVKTTLPCLPFTLAPSPTPRSRKRNLRAGRSVHLRVHPRVHPVQHRVRTRVAT